MKIALDVLGGDNAPLSTIEGAFSYLDYHGDVKCALRVSDCVINVISSPDGVMVGNDLIWEYSSKEFENPMMMAVNMCDREQSNYNSVIESLKDSVGRSIFPFAIPFDEGEGFSKVIDVLNKKLYTYDINTNTNYNSIAENLCDLSGMKTIADFLKRELEKLD